jgi:hypothetical protein
MKEIKKPQSGIIGQAVVVFGGAIKIDFCTNDSYPSTICVGLSELIEPCEKSGQVPDTTDTYMGTQVQLVFPDLHSLSYFRNNILNEAEIALKEMMRDAINTKIED